MDNVCHWLKLVVDQSSFMGDFIITVEIEEI